MLEFCSMTRCSVLVVEDSTFAQALLARAVESTQLALAVCVDDGRKALTAMNMMAFEVIITDLQLPHLNGYAVISYARSSEQYAQVPIIVVTADNRPEAREQCQKLGVDHYLVKPFHSEELTALVLSYCLREHG